MQDKVILDSCVIADTVYDSFFVAAAERENAPLLTMDRKLHEAIRKKRNVKLI